MTGKHNKNYEKSRRKVLREEYEDQHPHHTEGHWEDGVLEDNSYYDIDILNKANENTLKGIKYWRDEFQPSGNMGKWYQSIRLQHLYKKLKHYKR